MASSLAATLSTRMRTFNDMPAGRQVALISMVAGGLVTVAAILFWALTPSYAPLFGQIDSAEGAEVMQALTQLGVPYKVDNLTGRIEIPEQRIAETRLLLAGQGLPKSTDIGFELLQQEAGFGTSRLIEGARYQRALEGELGRSVAALDPVERARVHIAQAERSVFVRERTPPSASVVVHLKGRRGLTEAQVGAIVHLVSSSIPELTPERVTIVDQTGRLLTIDDKQDGNRLSLDNLDYTRRLEAGFAERVQSLLTPIVGRDRVRVQVTTEVDFSRAERTEETFDPERTAVRSEQTNEEERIGADPVSGGIPGALTNQPPQGGTVGEQAPAAGAPQIPSSRTQQATRNYEVDRTIAHIQETPGGIRRLTAAVVIDYQDQINDEGEPVRVPRSEAQMETIRALVREAVGFSAARGDSIQVSSASFVLDPLTEDGVAFWTEPWFLELVKIAGGFIIALVVLLTVVRPGLKQLTAKPEDPAALETDASQSALTDQSGERAEGDEVVALTHQPSALGALMGPKGTDQQQLDLNAVREMVKEDPKRVAQVMKGWLAEDGS